MIRDKKAYDKKSSGRGKIFSPPPVKSLHSLRSFRLFAVGGA